MNILFFGTFVWYLEMCHQPISKSKQVMKHYYVLVLLLVGFLFPVRAQVPVYGEYKSPDKKVVLKVYQEEAHFFFQVFRDK